VNGTDADEFPGGRGIDHLAVADIEADVMDLCVGDAVEDEVAGPKLGFENPYGGIVLSVRGPR
jgi:hypothetical protein